jgi:hypothetical protein
MEIDRGESGGWDADAVMRRPPFETVATATEWSEGHALRSKRVPDEPSVVCSRDLLVEGPHSPQCDRAAPLPLADRLPVQRDLGGQNASYASEQQVDAAAVGIPARGLLRKRLGSSRLGAPSQRASPSPTHDSYRTTGPDSRATGTRHS